MCVCVCVCIMCVYNSGGKERGWAWEQDEGTTLSNVDFRIMHVIKAYCTKESFGKFLNTHSLALP